MTKKGMKGWIIGLAAFAMLATTGVGLTGYFTKGFTQWKANENTSEKVEESSNDSSVLLEDSSLPGGDSEDSSVEEESDVFILANNKAAFRHILKANGGTVPEPDFRDYEIWNHDKVQVGEQDNGGLPNEFFTNVTKDYIACAVTVTGHNAIDYFYDDTPVLNSNATVRLRYLSDADIQGDDDSVYFYFGPRQDMQALATWYNPQMEGSFLKQTNFDYNLYWMQYSSDEVNGLKDGQTKDIFIDVDKNYSKETIIQSISAKDLFGAECAVTVTSGLDTFTPSTIGVYTLKLKATDSYGQTATATLIVHICDYVAPVITQAKALTFTADKNQKLSYADLPTYISVTDNGTGHGSSLTITYKYDGTVISNTWSKTFTAADYGSHTIAVNAKDGSGNEKNVTLTLKVNDGTAPVLERTDGASVGSKITIGVSKTFTMTLADVTQLFKATDNVDGNVSSSITGLTDADKNFFSTNHKVGSYTLTICAKDSNNNQVTQVIPIDIVADMPPVFIIADTLVYTDTANPLNVAQLNLVVSNGILANKNISSLSVDASEYIGHETEPGTYHIDYEYTLANNNKAARRFNANGNTITGAFDLIVQEANKEAEPEEPKEDNPFVAFFKSIGDFFVHFGNWFRGVFTHFDFTCWLSNEEFDERYPVEKEEVKESSTSTETPADTSTVTE